MAPAAPSTDTPEVRSYNRIRRWLGIYEFLLSLLGLIVLLATGWTRSLRDTAYFLAAQNYAVAVFYYVVILASLSKLLGIGIDYCSFRLEHRFRLSNQKFSSWLWDEAKSWLLTVVLGAIVVELLYFIIRAMPQYWWVIAWAAFLLLFVFFAQIAPVALFPLFYKFRPLEREDLKARLTRLGERAGARVRGVYEWKLSEKTKKANAALTGLGKTRRIILADTLLDNYSDDEIEAVLAHELGHHVQNHILKSIGIEALITFVGFWTATQVIHLAVRQHWFINDADFADLPLLMLVSTIVGFLLIPALNAWSRHNERQADLYALQLIPCVTPFIDAMNKLAEQNLAERTPSRWVKWFFHSHPPVSKRIAAAEAWRRRQASMKPITER
ncbi:MAG: M48 family metallopeptidase [Terriglobales bacterium]|jgi:STE24 endopeptidase